MDKEDESVAPGSEPDEPGSEPDEQEAGQPTEAAQTDKSKRNRRIILAVIIAIVIIIILLLLMRCSCSEQPEGSVVTVNDPPTSQLVDMEAIAREYSPEGIPVPDFSLDAVMYMTEGPGTPEGVDDPSAGPGEWQKPYMPEYPVWSDPFEDLSPVELRYHNSRLNEYPDLMENPFDVLYVKNPEAGMVLEGGSEFVLLWDTNDDRITHVTIVYSQDGGNQQYGMIVDKTVNLSTYQLIVPEVDSSNCIFRIDAYIDSIYVYSFRSPVFSIKTPVPPEVIEPPAPAYAQASGLFVSAGAGDEVRWVKVDHGLDGVDSIVWQIGKIDFPNNLDSPFDVPGLMVFGSLPGDTKEFKVDFAAIMTGIDAGQAPPNNRGAAFEVAPGAVQLHQFRYTLHIRALLLDAEGNVIGATVSSGFITYGDPIIAAQAADLMDIEPYPYLSITNPAFGYEGYYDSLEHGVVFYSGYDNKVSVMLKEWPVAHENGLIVLYPAAIELQVSTVPFSPEDLDSYLHPAGLVYSDNQRSYSEPGQFYGGLNPYKFDHYFALSLDDFMPSYAELGSQTVTYYMRAVVFYEGDELGVYKYDSSDRSSLVAVATAEYPIYYTGDYDFYESQVLVARQVPQNVVVKSNIPKTQVIRFTPVRYSLKNPEEYFEVTRRILPGEWGFYLENTVTGEKLYPYKWHQDHENMSYSEYQAKLDRMVPVGASFHVIPHQKNWFERVVGDFVELFTEIYNSLQQTYNGLKAKLINTLSSAFSSVFGGKAFWDKVFTVIIDYGLTSIGLPPSLPNIDVLALDSIDYLVRVGLEEAADSLGVSLDSLPIDVREEVSEAVQQQFLNMRSGDQNPFDVDYLRYSTEATYRPHIVYLQISNYTDVVSAQGTAYISFKTTSGSSLYMSETVHIPALQPGESLTFPVYLKANPSIAGGAFSTYYNENRPLTLSVYIKYDVPDAALVAGELGLKGEDPERPDRYVYDRSPAYVYTYDPLYLQNPLNRTDLEDSGK